MGQSLALSINLLSNLSNLSNLTVDERWGNIHY